MSGLGVVPRQAGEMSFKLLAYLLLFGYKKAWPEDKCHWRKRWGKFIVMTFASLKGLISRMWLMLFCFFFLNTIPKWHCFACGIPSELRSPGRLSIPLSLQEGAPQSSVVRKCWCPWSKQALGKFSGDFMQAGQSCAHGGTKPTCPSDGSGASENGGICSSQKEIFLCLV